MKKLTCCLGLILILVTWVSSLKGQPFSFRVKHKHSWGAAEGRLTIGEDGIVFDEEGKTHHRRWPYTELRRVEIASPNELVLYTYEDLKYRLGTEKRFKLTILDGEISSEIYRFLLSKTTRPLLTRVPYESGPFAFTLPVKRRGTFRSSQGELKVGDDRIVYETSHPKDSRIWLYKDVQSIGLVDPYQFRLSTFLESFTFDLKTPMSAAQYDYLWKRIYGLENPYSTPR